MRYANTCPTGHSTKGSHYRGAKSGENLAYSTIPNDETGTQAWYNEIKDCPSLPGCL